jgi:hypothetical protein
VLNLTPAAAAAEVKKRLDGLVVDPHVAVSLTSYRVATVSVVGEVRQAGSYPLRPGEGVLELLARAGGLSEFANKGRIFVVRRGAGSYSSLAAVNGTATDGADKSSKGAAASNGKSAPSEQPMRVRMSYDKLARADGAAVQCTCCCCAPATHLTTRPSLLARRCSSSSRSACPASAPATS